MNSTTTALPEYYESPIAEKLFDYVNAVRRRALPMSAVFGSVLAIALLLALLLPATYRSAGTILIEQQEIPEDFVRSAVSSFADQRVQTISQRVMTSANLLEIIDRHGLYADDRLNTPRERLIERIRDDISLEMISAEVVDPRRGGVTRATIAFSVAFKNESPEMAARVANDLISLYLRENLRTRKQLAEGSSEFLAGEAERLRRRNEELEQKISAFKRQHFKRLPEFAGANVQQLGRLAEEMREVEARIRSFDQQLVFLDSQLAQISRYAAVVTESGQRLLSPVDRLKALRAELEAAKARYAPSHPDVLRLQRQIVKLESEAAAQAADGKPVAGFENPDNPAYLQINAQREATLNERATLVARRSDLQRLIAGSERSQLEMPEVEREFRALELEAQAEQQKYAEIRQKQMAAQLSQNLESEQRGERFTLIDPPLQPQEPISPNRPLLAVGGLLLALAAGIGTLLLLEVMDTRVRGRRQIIDLLGEAPLAAIPWTAEPPNTAWRTLLREVKPVWLLAGGTVALAASLALVHWLFRPLDVLWAVLMRRFGV